MTEKRPELHVIREPETVERNVLHLSGISSHGPASPRPVGRPWPRQVAWQDRLTARRRRLALARGDLREALGPFDPSATGATSAILSGHPFT